MKRIFLTLSLLLCSIGATSLWAQIPQEEKEALLAIYKATDGANWEPQLRWDITQSPDKWSGITISNGHVVIVNLSGALLNGTLPEGVFPALPFLEGLVLDQNPNLKGAVPKDITSLSKLEALSLTYCSFTGALPSLNSFKQLRVLNLSMLNQTKDPNGFTATMPDFAEMPLLYYFDASYSGMKGNINEGIGKCTDLEYFDISGNLVEGTLPASLNNCTKLKDLSLQDNKLSGEIPNLSAITNITFDPMNGFYGRFFLNENQFTGRFPMWITALNDVKRISLSNNKLEGVLPDDLSTLLQLETFFADHNNISGELPKKLPPHLQRLALSHNKLTGTIPAEWREAKELNDVALDHNELSGKVQLKHALLSELETVRVSFNHFYFADFEGWDSFGKSKDTRFYFGLQKPYFATREVKVASGETAQLDATIPVEQPSSIKLNYKWYNTTTMEEIPNSPNSPILEIKNADKAVAHGYICLVVTDYFGDDPTGELSNNENSLRSEEKEILAPMLASGKIILYVDGATNTEKVTENRKTPYVYPTKVEDLLHIAHAEEVESLWIFNGKGEKVMAQKVKGNPIFSLSHLPQGSYWVVLLTTAGETYTTSIVR